MPAGYANKENIKEVKVLGIKAVGLPNKCGMNIEEMTGSEWIYNKFNRLRSRIEGNISMLKRLFGLNRCSWRGLEHFQYYDVSVVLAYDFNLYARLSRQGL